MRRRDARAAIPPAIVLGLALVVALPQAAPPDFSGRWVLSLQRSRIDPRVGAGLEGGTLRVTQTAQRVALARVFTAGGKEDRGGYDLALDGTEAATKEGPMVRRSRLGWEGEALVLRERIAAPQGEATNTVHYRLLDGGRTLEARESFRGPRFQYDNVWVFERQAK